MTDLHLLMPKLPVSGSALVAIAGSALYSISVNDAAGVGAVLVAALVVIVAGVFTLRNNLKSFWKELAEERGEQVKVLEADLKGKAQELLDAQLHHTEQMAAFAEEQREVRHQLKNQLADLGGRLKLEEAKHDLSGVLTRIDGLEATITGRSSMFEQIAAGIGDQSRLLTEIRELLAHPQPS